MKIEHVLQPEQVLQLIDNAISSTDPAHIGPLVKLRSDFMELKTHDAMPVTYGHWIEYLDGEGIMPDVYYQCSVCGARGFSHKHQACPRCTAIMTRPRN